MQFTRVEFLIFFAVVLVLAWGSRTRNQRHGVLLLASYYFYAYWDIRFCGLLAFSTLVDFFVARKIEASAGSGQAKRWLWVSVIANLGVLGFFKYFNFFIESAQPILKSMGWHVGSLDVILPVGISFFTFQTLSYAIDVYRGRIRSSRSFLEFSLYVAFFPQLVAGPIVRASELLPQFQQLPQWSGRRFYGGGQLILRGLVKKVLLADRMGEMVDVVFAGPDLYSGLTVWLAVIAYAGQIYYDFSGYTDIAIGAAKLLGYRFPRNFRHPYLARSLGDFWRRWHMTLSRWLRDYVYIPLGGSRQGSAETARNLIITMGLGGLWHGAAWTFLFWGLWHGMCLAVERSFGVRALSRLAPWVGRLWTIPVVLVGWVLFRSQDLSDCGLVLAKMGFQSSGIEWYPPLVVLAIALMLLEHLVWNTRLRIAMRLPADRWYSPVATAVMLWCLVLYAPRGFSPFVYFQF